MLIRHSLASSVVLTAALLGCDGGGVLESIRIKKSAGSETESADSKGASSTGSTSVDAPVQVGGAYLSCTQLPGMETATTNTAGCRLQTQAGDIIDWKSEYTVQNATTVKLSDGVAPNASPKVAGVDIVESPIDSGWHWFVSYGTEAPKMLFMIDITKKSGGNTMNVATEIQGQEWRKKPGGAIINLEVDLPGDRKSHESAGRNVFVMLPKFIESVKVTEKGAELVQLKLTLRQGANAVMGPCTYGLDEGDASPVKPALFLKPRGSNKYDPHSSKPVLVNFVFRGCEGAYGAWPGKVAEIDNAILETSSALPDHELKAANITMEAELELFEMIKN